MFLWEITKHGCCHDGFVDKIKENDSERTEKGRDFIIQVPNRIYERVAKALMSKYRNLVSITFGYVSLPGSYATKGMMKSHYISARGHRRRRRQKAGAQVQSPAIFFEAKT